LLQVNNELAMGDTEGSFTLAIIEVPFGICIELYRIVRIDFSDLYQSNFQKTFSIIINIDIAITKTDMIISEIEIAYV
jgi:hypothetical protein